ncbi:MAG TPA: PhoH family protein, partial [Usitatibacteraceae bacterium]|nr:PhoH family protein [Usitatibacteraceae bacterium]
MKAPSLEFAFTPVDNRRLAALCGSMDANLRQIETALDVAIARRGERFSVSGERERIELAARVLNRFYAKAHGDVTVEEIQLGIVEMAHARAGGGSATAAGPGDAAAEEIVLHTRRADLKARTERQAQYIRQMLTHDICFGVGPAGTGKTYLAVACAVDAFERDLVKRIVLTRPAVEAGEKLGYLPG